MSLTREQQADRYLRCEVALQMRKDGTGWKEIGLALGGVSRERARQLAAKGERVRRTPADVVARANARYA